MTNENDKEKIKKENKEKKSLWKRIWLNPKVKEFFDIKKPIKIDIDVWDILTLFQSLQGHIGYWYTKDNSNKSTRRWIFEIIFFLTIMILCIIAFIWSNNIHIVK